LVTRSGVVDEHDAMIVKHREEDRTLVHQVYLRDKDGVWFVTDMLRLMEFFEKRLRVWREYLAPAMDPMLEDAAEDLEWWRAMWKQLESEQVSRGVSFVLKTSIGWVLRLYACYINAAFPNMHCPMDVGLENYEDLCIFCRALPTTDLALDFPCCHLCYRDWIR
jgi:hypothetical protein